MRRQGLIVSGFLLCVMLIGLMGREAWSVNGPPTDRSTSFFSQGQAVYLAQDRAKSQEEAIRDFLIQGVTQAVATYLSPSQMGSQFGAIQEKVLKQPERYVETYQVFSESPIGGLYRVTGQVTVSMEALKKDLMKFGLTFAEPATEPSSQVQAEQTAAVEMPSAAETQEVKASKSAREGTSAKRKLLWVVTERWGQEWYLPRDRRDPHSLFALSMLQESQDYDWSLVFPTSESVSVDERGRISQDQALSLAGTLGAQGVVLGTADLQPKGSQDVLLVVRLRVLDASAGVNQGEIRKELDLEGASDQQGAMEMAFALVPQLDRLVREQSPAAGRDQITQEDRESFRGMGEWTLVIRSQHQYAYWEDLAKILLDRFKSMRVRSMELGDEEAKIRVSGVDGEYLASLQGTQVREGVWVQVEELFPEAHSVRLTFTHSESVRPETFQ